MKLAIWKKLEQVNTYLHAKEEAGVKAFQQLIVKLEEAETSWGVITFTYEQLEVYGKVGADLISWNTLADLLSKEGIEGLLAYEYEEKPAEEYQFWSLKDCSQELLKIWLMNCFQEALLATPSSRPIYYKHNHDDLEILALQTGDVWLEKSELEAYVENNRANNTLELLG